MRGGRRARRWKDPAASPEPHSAAQAVKNASDVTHCEKTFHILHQDLCESVYYRLVYLELHVVLVAEQLIGPRRAELLCRVS